MDRSAASWFDEGAKAFEKGELERAIAAFDQVLGLEPAHFLALKQRALSLARLGQHEAALDSFVAAADQQQFDPDLILGAAQSLLKVRRTPEALQSFERFRSLRPFDTDGQIGLASALMASGEFERSLAAWDALLAVPDKDTSRRAQALRARVLALGQLNRPEAFTAFKERLQEDLAHLAPEEKRAALLRAIDRDPPAPEAFDLWVEAHARENWSRVDDLWFEQSTSKWNVTSCFATAWFRAGNAELEEGKLSHAIYCYERALELVPQFPEVTAQLQVASAHRDSGPWMILRHDSYAREDNFVAEFPNRLEAERRVKELNALGGDHHWAVASK